MKYLIAALGAVLVVPGIAQRAKPDTFVTVTVPARTMRVPVPVIRDTIRIVDTVYQCPPVRPAKQLAVSRWLGTPQQLVDSCIASRSTLLIDAHWRLRASLMVNGDLVIVNQDTVTLLGNASLQLREGRHELLGGVWQRPSATVRDAAITQQGQRWHNELRGLTLTSNMAGYMASRGTGVATVISDSRLRTGWSAVGVFSQDSDSNRLELRRVQLHTDSSHHIYIHPNVSVDYADVTTTGRPLSQHQFSGAGTGYDRQASARYLRCRSQVASAMWGMTPVAGDGYTIIDSCELAPYHMLGVKPAKVLATASRIANGGNGASLRGRLVNCTGEVWGPGVGDTLELVGGTYRFISMRPGGVLIVDGADVEWLNVADRGARFEVILRNSRVAVLDDSRAAEGRIQATNSTIGRSNARAALIER